MRQKANTRGRRDTSALMLVAALVAAAGICAPTSAARSLLVQVLNGAAASGAAFYASIANAVASTQATAKAGLQPTVADICPFLKNSDTATACGMIKSVEEATIANTSETTCVPNRQVPLTTAPAPLTALPKPIAPDLSYAELAPVEGATYAWMWRLFTNLANWWPCWTTGEQFSPPTGYRGIGGDIAGHPGVFGLDGGKPFMAAMSNGAHFVVAVRCTYTVAEWELDFAWNLLPVSRAPFEAVTLSGRLHFGFAKVAQQLWVGLKQAIDAEVLAPGSAVTRVTVTGHSLGASLGTILSAVAAEYIATATATAPRAVAVEGVFFGSPTIGDAQFADWVAARVNLRSLAFEHDAIPLLACESMPACANTPVPTNAEADGDAWIGYSPTHGRTTILSTNLPTEVDIWQSTAQLYPLDKYPLKRLASHNCVYTCALSKYGSYLSDECHIGAGDPEPGHTTCPWSGPVV